MTKGLRSFFLTLQYASLQYSKAKTFKHHLILKLGKTNLRFQYLMGKT